MTTWRADRSEVENLLVKGAELEQRMEQMSRQLRLTEDELGRSFLLHAVRGYSLCALWSPSNQTLILVGFARMLIRRNSTGEISSFS